MQRVPRLANEPPVHLQSAGLYMGLLVRVPLIDLPISAVTPAHDDAHFVVQLVISATHFEAVQVYVTCPNHYLLLCTSARVWIDK